MPTQTSDLTVSQAALSRVSIRKYTDRVPTREEIDELLTIASKAPSSYNVQPWRVVVVTDPEVKNKLMEAAYGQPQVGAAPALFVIYSDTTDVVENADEIVHPGLGDRKGEVVQQVVGMLGPMDIEDREAWGNAQSNIFLGYFLLAAEAKGWGTSPMLGFVADKVKKILGLPAHVRIPALVSLGEKAEDGFPQYRHPISRIAKYV